MANVVQLSEASTLAMHAMMMIAMSKDKYLNVIDMAWRTNASRNHLSKVMQQLAKAQLVYSLRGPSGGFILAKNPSEITLLSIYEVIEGPINAVDNSHKSTCPLEKCYLKELSDSFSLQMKVALEAKTLKDFMG